MNNQSVLNTDRFDRRRFQDYFEMSTNLQKLADKAKGTFPSFFPLMGDIWASLYKVRPQLKEAGEYEDKLQMNHQLLSKLMVENSFDDLRYTTVLDELSSALGTLNYSEEMYGWIEEQAQKNQELKEALKEAARLEKTLQKAQEALQQAEQDLEQAGDNPAEQKNAKSRKKRAENRAQNLQEQLQEYMESLQQQMKQSIRVNQDSFQKALNQAADKTQQTKEDLVSLLSGGTTAGNGEAELKKIPVRDQIKLAEIMAKNEKLREIAEWAGRFKAIARKKQKSKHKETVNRSGVTVGAELERLLSSELAAYTHLITKWDFLRRYAEGQTMMYDARGKETLGKGPILLCLDQSGSMKQLDAQSKGFALALMMIAKKQKRDFAMILFSTKVETFLYPKGKITANDIGELASTFLSGGTHYDKPLLKAAELLQQSHFQKGDVIFVTDGDGRLPESELETFLKVKKEQEVNVLSLALGPEKMDKLPKFSDKIVKASSFDNETAMDAAFSI